MTSYDWCTKCSVTAAEIIVACAALYGSVVQFVQFEMITQLCPRVWEGKKEILLFNDTLNTFLFYGYMVSDQR